MLVQVDEDQIVVPFGEYDSVEILIPLFKRMF